ncbi:MAG TPA: hypothetical protein ENJ43_07580 [Gammaproteobacteria bacterium]|nr:hypothetical protein [Gammaproteobacteria bacterium]
MNRIAITFLSGLLCLAPLAVSAADPVEKSVAELYKEKDQLKGQQVQLQGKVVKVNNGILNRNFIHLQDGTGEKGSNDVTVTSQDTAQVGDQVKVVGTVTLDLDFGSGYTYPLIVEKASITKVEK